MKAKLLVRCKKRRFDEIDDEDPVMDMFLEQLGSGDANFQPMVKMARALKSTGDR